MGAPPSLAMLQCVRDEEELLGANLAYHHALGVSRAYVFLDRCTDASRQVASAFPWVEIIEQDRDRRDAFLGLHQARCADTALKLARSEGFEWLLHVDADEFACGDDRSEVARWLARRLPQRWRALPELAGSLTAMLARAQPGTELVILRTREVVPSPLPPGAPFWKLDRFQIRGGMRRPLLDPVSGEVRELRNWLGHELGKSIVRTTADVRAVDSHRWCRASGQGELATEHRGFHYHYVVVGPQHWWKKYRRLAEYPDHWQHNRGPVRFPKQAWKQAAGQMSAAEAAAYYEQWVVVPQHEVRFRPLHYWVVRDPFVADVLARVTAPPAAAAKRRRA